MARGNTCPSCGHDTFHRFEATTKRRGTAKRAYRKCSHCGVTGWFGSPTSVGSGGGKRCEKCGEDKLFEIYQGRKAQIEFCRNNDCRALLIHLP